MQVQSPRSLVTSGGQVEDALDYLQKVKERFHDQPGKYTEFLRIMKDYENQRYC
jgi:histone deacetylase complex regulatory component SIN3